MLQAIRDGRVDGVIVWHLDRLTRHPRELEEFFETCDGAGVRDMASVTGDIDLGTDDGRFHARILGAVARKSSDDMSRRIQRKQAELAAAGRTSGGGTRPFGYDDDRMTVREDEALEIKRAAERLLLGGSIRGACVDLNDRGILTPTGGKWSTQGFRRMIRSARIAGLREHDDVVVADAVWPAIIDRSTHERIRALLDAPSRYSGTTRRAYLLSGGLLRCGLCGAALVGRPTTNKTRTYVCAKGPGLHGCGKLKIQAEPLEENIREAVFTRLLSPDLHRGWAEAQSGDDAAEDVRRLTELEAAADALAGMLGAAQLTQRAYIAASRANETEQAAVHKRIEQRRAEPVLAEVPNTEAALRKWWKDTADLLEQRALIGALTERIEIAPAVRGLNRFDERRVSVAWRDSLSGIDGRA
jgi:hypothetical protein